MNPRLPRLQPCTFERLRQWFADVPPIPARAPISLSIGEPRHPTPAPLADALAAGISGRANYPTTIGPPVLRKAIASWLARRHGTNPGRGYIRIALGAQRDECAAAVERIVTLDRSL